MNNPPNNLESSTEQCPSCGVDVGLGAVLCVKCGFHLQTGQHLATVVDSEKSTEADDNPYASPEVPSGVVTKSARVPDWVVFRCESCGKQSKTNTGLGKHLLPWRRTMPVDLGGHCKKCSGGSWEISVTFSETSADNQLLVLGAILAAASTGIGLFALLGMGVSRRSTASNQQDFPKVPASVVAQINEVPQQRMEKVAAFVTKMNRDRLKQKGGRECKCCGALYVPVPSKLWTTKGFCSIQCGNNIEGSLAYVTSNVFEDTESQQANIIQLQCTAGHQFGVPKSFSGMTRPCPECGVKTVVP
ncbi:MAG: hypothetical protein COA78_30660 [Blastopirellula sp.]|nr:MAG: hypothetical protein COA78_30660 [Blastopirellula sp.]